MVSRAYGPGTQSGLDRLMAMLKRGPATREQILLALGSSTGHEAIKNARKAGFVQDRDGRIELVEDD
jgi:hypothetical protein